MSGTPLDQWLLDWQDWNLEHLKASSEGETPMSERGTSDYDLLHEALVHVYGFTPGEAAEEKWYDRAVGEKRTIHVSRWEGVTTVYMLNAGSATLWSVQVGAAAPDSIVADAIERAIVDAVTAKED